MGYITDYSNYRIDYHNFNGTIAGGAYDQCMYQKNLQADFLTPTEEEQQAAEALKEKLKGVTVTISTEAVDFMAGLRERKEAMYAENERIREENSYLNKEDAFDRIGTQFSVFSGALSEMGFYDDLSDDETLQMECILGGITYGMNSLCGNVKEAQPSCGVLSSHAARFELESSTAALRQFSEKFLPLDMRETFDCLVDQYYEHNAKALEGYRSSFEISNEGMAGIYDTTASMRAIPLNKTEKIVWQLGKVKTEEADYANAAESWKKQFQMLVNGEKSVDDSVTMMQDTLNALASGNSKNQELLQYVSRWNSFSIENARHYWSLLT